MGQRMNQYFKVLNRATREIIPKLARCSGGENSIVKQLSL